MIDSECLHLPIKLPLVSTSFNKPRVLCDAHIPITMLCYSQIKRVSLWRISLWLLFGLTVFICKVIHPAPGPLNQVDKSVHHSSCRVTKLSLQTCKAIHGSCKNIASLSANLPSPTPISTQLCSRFQALSSTFNLNLPLTYGFVFTFKWDSL